jgi:large subunit ribosomal protein L21
MYAVIETAGRQHRVTTGEILHLDRKVNADEKSITIDRVFLVGGEGSPKVGNPVVAGATVTCEVVRSFRGPKIDIIKYKRRKGYHKKQGHRQSLVEVKVTGINV